MESIKVSAYAKINLGLDILGVKENGYHNVDMLMARINLCDNLKIEKAKSGISLAVNKAQLPVDETNIAYQSAQAFFSFTGIDGGAKISLDKHIPIAAGLAGGSADGAAVIMGLNGLYSAKMSTDQMSAIGVKIGADVPYCLHKKIARATNIGEKLEFLDTKIKFAIVLVKPQISVSTPWAYKMIDTMPIKNHPDIDALVKYIKANDARSLSKHMKNVFEEVIEPRHKVVVDIKRKMYECGALGSMMSGSGPSVFGIYTSFIKAVSVAKIFRKTGFAAFACMTL